MSLMLRRNLKKAAPLKKPPATLFNLLKGFEKKFKDLIYEEWMHDESTFWYREAEEVNPGMVRFSGYWYDATQMAWMVVCRCYGIDHETGRKKTK